MYPWLWGEGGFIRGVSGGQTCVSFLRGRGKKVGNEMVGYIWRLCRETRETGDCNVGHLHCCQFNERGGRVG